MPPQMSALRLLQPSPVLTAELQMTPSQQPTANHQFLVTNIGMTILLSIVLTGPREPGVAAL
eukprot:6232594-Alexandrium_andersonii.AAC.1